MPEEEIKIVKPEDTDTYLFNLKIGDKSYTIDTKWLLNLKVEITDTLSDFELEDSLQKIAGYLHTFSSAYEEANKFKNLTSLEYDIWYSKVYSEIESKLSNKYSNEISAGLRSKTNSSPTKSQVETELILNNEIDYVKWNALLIDNSSKADYLMRELKLIESRGTHLQTLIKSRQTIRNIEGNS